MNLPFFFLQTLEAVAYGYIHLANMVAQTRKRRQTLLYRTQRLVCIRITNKIRSSPTSAIKACEDLVSLHKHCDRCNKAKTKTIRQIEDLMGHLEIPQKLDKLGKISKPYHTKVRLWQFQVIIQDCKIWFLLYLK